MAWFQDRRKALSAHAVGSETPPKPWPLHKERRKADSLGILKDRLRRERSPLLDILEDRPARRVVA